MFHLVAPFINDWHVDVINKAGHFAAGWRAVRGPHTFVHVTFNGPLLNTERQVSLDNLVTLDVDDLVCILSVYLVNLPEIATVW